LDDRDEQEVDQDLYTNRLSGVSTVWGNLLTSYVPEGRVKTW